MSAMPPLVSVQAKQVNESGAPVIQADFGETQETYRHYQRLVERVIDVFGDEVRANLWLSEPSTALGGETPLQVARRDKYSVDTLEPVLVRLEHGIYA